MAKLSKSFKSNNCEIDSDEMKLVETIKDGVLVYDLKKLLDSWSGLQGLNFNITLNEEIEPDDTVY